jgi:hypothetical protein
LVHSPSLIGPQKVLFCAFLLLYRRPQFLPQPAPCLLPPWQHIPVHDALVRHTIEKMKLPLISNTVALLTIAGLATHSSAKVAPLKILGGKQALTDFGAVSPAQLDAPPAIGPLKFQSRHMLEPRHWKNPPAEKNKKCGPGVGSCNPGYCCSIGGHWLVNPFTQRRPTILTHITAEQATTTAPAQPAS